MKKTRRKRIQQSSSHSRCERYVTDHRVNFLASDKIESLLWWNHEEVRHYPEFPTYPSDFGLLLTSHHII